MNEAEMTALLLEIRDGVRDTTRRLNAIEAEAHAISRRLARLEGPVATGRVSGRLLRLLGA
ncbi:MAG TPA: hypothetical protein VF244_10455 [Acidimicrobiales bacterium]